MNLEFEGRRFAGYFQYGHGCMGSFYEAVGQQRIYYLVIPFQIKNVVIDAELEADQEKHFGPAIRNLPQLILNLQDKSKFLRSQILKKEYM